VPNQTAEVKPNSAAVEKKAAVQKSPGNAGAATMRHPATPAANQARPSGPTKRARPEQSVEPRSFWVTRPPEDGGAAKRATAPAQSVEPQSFWVSRPPRGTR
jgi:hypothetical protein